LHLTKSETRISFSKFAVLGTGFAGLAASQKLAEQGHNVVAYEKMSAIGGHARSYDLSGFIFDDGPHVSFSERPDVKQFLEDSVQGEFREFETVAINYWNGHWVRHPAQTNMFGLPPETITDVVVDIVEAHQQPDLPPPVNYEEWCLQTLGKTFSEEFTFKYTRKYWTTEARNLTVDWVGPRMYPPSVKEVVSGALAASTEQHHYLKKFRYPINGGFGAYTDGLNVGQTIELGKDVNALDLEERRISFSDGSSAEYEQLISSIPLPELVSRIKGAPPEIEQAAQKLTCSQLILVSIGIDRVDGLPDADWVYFYDEDIIFSRLHFPYRFASSNAPEGCGSLQVEIYHSKYLDLPDEDLTQRTINDLKKCGIIRESDKIMVAHEARVPYANVVFDHPREENLQIVNQFLDDHSVIRCGRFGEWEYHWTDDAISSGWRAAQDAIERG
jgi:protoporphyrinogen oxidase